MNVLVLDWRNDVASSTICGRVARVGTPYEKFIVRDRKRRDFMANGIYFFKGVNLLLAKGLMT